MAINRIKGKELLGKIIAEHLTAIINNSKWSCPYRIVIPIFGDNNVEFRIIEEEKENILFKLSFGKDGRTLHLDPLALHAFPEIENVISLFSVLDFNKIG